LVLLLFISQIFHFNAI